MGGYGWYVWMSYGIVALLVVVETLAVRARLRRARAAAHVAPAANPVPTVRFEPAERP
jgi:heme exporter protein CcmD